MKLQLRWGTLSLANRDRRHHARKGLSVAHFQVCNRHDATLKRWAATKRLIFTSFGIQGQMYQQLPSSSLQLLLLHLFR